MRGLARLYPGVYLGVHLEVHLVGHLGEEFEKVRKGVERFEKV